MCVYNNLLWKHPSGLTNTFQTGWNRQLDTVLVFLNQFAFIYKDHQPTNPFRNRSCIVMAYMVPKRYQTTSSMCSKQKNWRFWSQTSLNWIKSIWVFPKIVGFPPKSSILRGFSIINHPFWGPTPIFGNTHLYCPQSLIWRFRPLKNEFWKMSWTIMSFRNVYCILVINYCMCIYIYTHLFARLLAAFCCSMMELMKQIYFKDSIEPRKTLLLSIESWLFF